MAKAHPDPFESIDPTALETVSGGRTASLGGSTNKMMLQLLTEISSSLAALTQHQQSSPVEQLFQMWAQKNGMGPLAAVTAAAKPTTVRTTDIKGSKW